MIGKRGKLLIFVYIIFLTVLFLMCSTDLIIREPEKEIYQIAVIIEDAGDDNYGNFRKGMDQAAIEFNADVRFITLYEKLNAEQQMELISREQQDGVDALVVVPVDERRMADMLEEKRLSAPVVILGSETVERNAAGSVVVDYRKMGEQLAEQMLGRIPEDCPVILLREDESRSTMSDDFLKGADTVLQSSGRESLTLAVGGETVYKKIPESLDEDKLVILAESPEILSETAQILAENPGFSGRVQGLYGRGNTLSISGSLDRGLITGVCVTDEFGRGYYSVRMAVEALEGRKTQKTMVMDSYYIEKKDLREPKYEKVLFPME